MTKPPLLPLDDNNAIPQLGFGTWDLRGNSAAIAQALETGYRHLDTADMYHTHDDIAQALNQTGIPRSQVFITTKLWSHSLAKDKVGPAVDRFLSELQTDFLDLLLIHWPSPSVPFAETLAAMDQTRQAGKVRFVGVSNFSVAQIQEALDTGVPLANNQTEYNFNHQPGDVLDFCLAHNVAVTSYSSLERGTRSQEQTVAQIATAHQATREQTLLAWLMAKGMIVIPRSSKPAHIQANFDSLQVKLSDADIAALDAAA